MRSPLPGGIAFSLLDEVKLPDRLGVRHNFGTVSTAGLHSTSVTQIISYTRVDSHNIGHSCVVVGEFP